MKKVWSNYGMFRDLEPKTREFLEHQEGVLDADRNWTPKGGGDPPINGEEAWPLIGEEDEQKR